MCKSFKCDSWFKDIRYPDSDRDTIALYTLPYCATLTSLSYHIITLNLLVDATPEEVNAKKMVFVFGKKQWFLQQALKYNDREHTSNQVRRKLPQVKSLWTQQQCFLVREICLWWSPDHRR